MAECVRDGAVMSAHAQCPHPFIGLDSQKWANMKHLPELFHCKRFLMID